jgi:hypothetical protein
MFGLSAAGPGKRTADPVPEETTWRPAEARVRWACIDRFCVTSVREGVNMAGWKRKEFCEMTNLIRSANDAEEKTRGGGCFVGFRKLDERS